MMRRAIYILLLILTPVFMHAQERELIIKKPVDVNLGDLRAKADPVPDSTGKPTAWLEISFASADSLFFDGRNGRIVDKVHIPGKWILYLSEGTEEIEITAPGYRILHITFPSDKRLLSAYVYTMELGSRVLNPMRTLIMPTFSYNKSQLSYGIMLALGKKNGGFVHAKTDFHFGLNPKGSCDADGNVDGSKGWFTGESQKSRFAITAGYMRQIFELRDGNMGLYAFAGGGYGRRILAWEMYRSENTYEYVSVEPYSFSGVEVEIGALFRIGPVAFSAGVQTNQFKYYEANVGIGVMF